MANVPAQSDPAAADVATSAEHLARLHKMSTTAGVTNRDYVAINWTAVAGVFLALVSALALLTPYLLIVPAVGVIVAIVALVQIKGSGGTQTGRPMALAALALCLLIAGTVVTRLTVAFLATRADESKIAATVADLGKLIRDAGHQQAYALFDDEFQSRVSPKQFETTLQSIQRSGPLGPMQVCEWNGVTPRFFSSAGSREAAIQLRIKFARSDEARVDVVLRQVGDRWLITQLPAFFPENDARDKDVFDLPPESFK